MSFIAPLRPGRESRRKIAFVLAVFLPVIATVLTDRVGALRGLPYSLHLLAVVVVGILGGLAPSLLTVLVSLLSRCCMLLMSTEHTLSIYAELLHVLVLVAAALVGFP